MIIFLFSCKSNEDKLFDYITDKDYDGLKTLFNQKLISNINFRNTQNQTPLFYAILQKDQTATSILIENGADVNDRFGDTISILGLALLSDNENIIENICKKNSSINKNCYKNLPPIHFAVNQNKVKLISILLQNKADINLVDTFGNTPIFYSKTPEMVGLLITNNAKTTIENKNKQTVKEFITIQSIQDQFNKRLTFKVSDVKGANNLRLETTYINSIKRIVKRYKMPLGGFPSHWDEFKNNYNQKILCVSDTVKLIETDYNPFIASVEFAYYEERPLVISPDMIWLLICQGFSQHIQQNSEKYRDKLVNFQGKKGHPS